MGWKAFAPLAAFLASAGAASAATVDVRVDKVANAKGEVIVVLCDEAQFLKKCERSAHVAARKGVVPVKFKDVPAGAYAAIVYHDENRNGKMDRNPLGIPTEGWAFSRGAKGRRGPPTFKDSAVVISASDAEIPVKLSY